MSDALALVRAERARQDARYGPAADRGYSPYQWLAVLTEEVGEVAKAINDCDTVNLQEELVHVAAVAIAFTEATLAELG